jgi:hypothetical protein
MDTIQPGYRCRLGLGVPDASPAEPVNNRPLRVGNFFQFRILITGHCKFMAMKVAANPEPQQTYAKIETSQADPSAIGGPDCQAITASIPNELTLYSLQG